MYLAQTISLHILTAGCGVLVIRHRKQEIIKVKCLLTNTLVNIWNSETLSSLPIP